MASQRQRQARLGGEAVKVISRLDDPNAPGFSYWSGYLDGLAFALVSNRLADPFALPDRDEVFWVNNYLRTIEDTGQLRLSEVEVVRMSQAWTAWLSSREAAMLGGNQ